MLIPSPLYASDAPAPSLSRRVNANSQRFSSPWPTMVKLIKKGEC